MAFTVRGMPEHVVEKLDREASRRDMSRNEYIIEVLTEHVLSVRPKVTAESFARAAEMAVDLDDKELMRDAWS